jgi:hypothetical protein
VLIPTYNSQLSLTKEAPGVTISPEATGALEARAMQEVGQATANVGQMIAQVGQKIKKVRQEEEIGRQTIEATNGINQIEWDAAKDTETTGFDERYEGKLTDLRNSVMAKFKDKEAAQEFSRRFDLDLSNSRFKIKQFGYKNLIDQRLATMGEQLVQYKESYLNETNPQLKQQYLDKVATLFTTARDDGIITKTDAQKNYEKARQDLETARVSHDMLKDPEFVLDELNKGDAGIYKNVSQEERDKLIPTAERRITILDSAQKKQETVNQVVTRGNYINDIVHNKFDLTTSSDLIRQIGIKDPKLGEALQKVTDNQGLLDIKEDDEAFSKLAKSVFSASSQEEISDFVLNSLVNKGDEISKEKLAILIDTANEYAKSLRVTKDSPAITPDPKHSAIASGVKSILDTANKFNRFNPGYLLGNFLKGIMSGKSAQEAHTEAVQSEVNRTNPLNTKYKLGDIITNSKGEMAEVTGFNENGSPIVKRKVSGKPNPSTK